MVLFALAIEPKELLPGILVDEGVVFFDASIAMDCHHPETPDVYLEMLITGPDTREHESLLVTDVKPSNLHAALLAAGFEPGTPMKYNGQHDRVSATGDRLVVEVQLENTQDWITLVDWVVHVDEILLLVDDPGWDGFVFAGSKVVEGKGYIADREGSLISLTPWGHEVISPTWTLSPDASVDEPVWIANRDQVPRKGDLVRVRIRGEGSKEDSADAED